MEKKVTRFKGQNSGGKVHTAVLPTEPFQFKLSDNGNAVAHTQFEINIGDSPNWVPGQLDQDGVKEYQLIPGIKVKIRYLNPDEINAIGLAKQIKQALLQKEQAKVIPIPIPFAEDPIQVPVPDAMTESQDAAVIRLLMHSPSQIQAMVAQYEKLYSANFVEDLTKTLAPVNVPPVLGLLVVAGIKTPGGETHVPIETQRLNRRKKVDYWINAEPDHFGITAYTPSKYTFGHPPEVSPVNAPTYRQVQWYCINDLSAVKTYGTPEIVMGPENGVFELGSGGFFSSKPAWTQPGYHTIVCRVAETGHLKNPRPPIYLSYPQWIAPWKVLHEFELKNKKVEDLPNPDLAVEQVERCIAQYNPLVGASVELYRQKEAKIKAMREYKEKLKVFLADTEGKNRIPLKAIYTIDHQLESDVRSDYPELLGPNFLSIFLVKLGEKKWQIVDWTNPASDRLCGKYPKHGATGATDEQAILAAIADWASDNSYCPGSITLEIPKELFGGNQDIVKTMTGNGQNWRQTLAAWLEAISLGLMIAMGILLLVAPIPGAQIASAVIWTTLFASIATGVGAGTLRLYDRYDKGVINANADLMDKLGIVTGLFGMSWAGLSARWGSKLFMLVDDGMKLSQYARTYSFYGMITGDSIQGVLLTGELYAQMKETYLDGTISTREKSLKLIKLTGEGLAMGALFYVDFKGVDINKWPKLLKATDRFYTKMNDVINTRATKNGKEEHKVQRFEQQTHKNVSPAATAEKPDVLAMSREQFKNSPEAQKELYNKARALRQDMENFATESIATLNLKNAEFVAILKRDKYDEFVDGVLEKMHRKSYKTVSQMDDIARGRFNLHGMEDVEKLVQHFRSQKFHVEVNPPKSIEGIDKGYPRFHVIVSHPETGMTFEWQVGTKATTIIYEHAVPGVPLHGLKLKPGMHPNLHDIQYDIFSFMLNSKNIEVSSYAKKIGIPEFNKRVALLSKESYDHAHQFDEKYWRDKVNALHQEAGMLLKRILDDKGRKFVEDFFH